MIGNNWRLPWPRQRFCDYVILYYQVIVFEEACKSPFHFLGPHNYKIEMAFFSPGVSELSKLLMYKSFLLEYTLQHGRFAYFGH